MRICYYGRIPETTPRPISRSAAPPSLAPSAHGGIFQSSRSASPLGALRISHSLAKRRLWRPHAFSQIPNVDFARDIACYARFPFISLPLNDASVVHMRRPKAHPTWANGRISAASIATVGRARVWSETTPIVLGTVAECRVPFNPHARHGVFRHSFLCVCANLARVTPRRRFPTLFGRACPIYPVLLVSHTQPWDSNNLSSSFSPL